MRGETLLLVEGRSITAMAEQAALEHYGYSVLQARSGEAAIETLRTHPEIDLILMDMDLGAGLNGPETAARILREREVPVIFLSDTMAPEVLAQTEHVSSYGHVMKTAGTPALDASIQVAARLFEKERIIQEQQRRLQESNAKLSAILGNTTDSIGAINRAHELLYANTVFLRTFVACTGVAVGPGDNLLEALPSTLRPVWKERVDQALSNHHLVFEQSVEGDSGTSWFEVDAHPIVIQDKIVGVSFFAKDITGRKQTELALRAEQGRLAHLIACADVGTWEWHVQTGRFVVNEKWAGMLGYHQAEWLTDGMDMALRLVHPDDVERVSAALKDHLRDKSDHYECAFRMRHKNGNWVWLLGKGKLVSRDAQGVPEWMFGTHTDIGGLKRTEDAMQVSLQEKNVLLRELQHRAKNSFSLIGAMIQLMRPTVSSPDAITALEEIHSRVLAISGVYDLLNASDPSTTVRLDDYLRKLAPEVLELAENITVVCRCEAITVPARLADTVGLIAVELITNAVKHAFPNGRAGRLEVALEQTDSAIRLDVIDDGVGFPDDLDLAHPHTLGLRLIQGLVQQVNGSLTVTCGPGTHYSIRIPCNQEPRPGTYRHP